MNILSSAKEEDADFIAYTMPENIAKIVEELEAFDISKAIENFQPKTFAEKEIYPDIWRVEEKEELQEGVYYV